MVPEDYVHRIGRTGRAGVDGDAVSLVCVDEAKLLRDIEKVLRRPIPTEVIPGFEPDRAARPEPIRLRSAPGERVQQVRRPAAGPASSPRPVAPRSVAPRPAGQAARHPNAEPGRRGSGVGLGAVGLGAGQGRGPGRPSNGNPAGGHQRRHGGGGHAAGSRPESGPRTEWGRRPDAGPGRMTALPGERLSRSSDRS
jgi:ATP-dependent RNA helicase RhlE